MPAGNGFIPQQLATIPVRALYIAKRIQVRALERRDVIALSPLTLRVGARGCAVVFRYGAVIFFNVPAADEAALLDYLKPHLAEPRATPEREEIVIHAEPGGNESLQGSDLYLAEPSLEQLQIIAEILAKSIVLDYYESRVARSFDLIEPFALRLTRLPLRWSKPRELLIHIGEVLITQQEMVGRIEVSEKPELLWDHPELERLYARLEAEYEIRDRHRAIERKLELISRTAETVLDILQARRNLRVEWYIVILIVVEILISVYELFYLR